MRPARRLALVLAVAAAVAVGADPVRADEPRVTGVPQVGAVLECGPDRLGATYAWERDGQPIPGADGRWLLLGDGDLDRRVACTMTPADAESRRSDPVGPVAATVTLRLTSRSPIVRGDIGRAQGGVTVRVALIRGGGMVAEAETATTAAGAFELELPGGLAPAERDVVEVDHASLPRLRVGPLTADAVRDAGAGLLVASPRSATAADPSGCGHLSAIRGEALLPAFVPGPAPSHGGLCTLRVTDLRADAPVDWTADAGVVPAGASPSVEPRIARLMMAGRLPGPAPCRALLAEGTVECSGSWSTDDEVVRLRAGSAPEVRRARALGDPRYIPVWGAEFDSLAAGDVVEVRARGGVAAAFRIPLLRVHEERRDSRTTEVTQTCPPARLLGRLAAWPCPASGTFTSSVVWDSYAVYDEVADAEIVTRVPRVGDVAPLPRETTWSRAVHLEARLDARTADLGATVHARVRRAGGGVVFDGPVDPSAGTVVSGLVGGRYVTTWQATGTRNGDTSTMTTEFLVRIPDPVAPRQGPAGAAGAPGVDAPPGAAGTPGPDGTPGRNARNGPLRCRVRKAKSARSVRVRCAVVVGAGGRARLVRGERTVAYGTVRGGYATFTRRAVRPGRYQLIVVTAGRRPRTLRTPVIVPWR